eukprot:Phypoly_transcript_03237.p1 GENE.Phypoly_transcript_03237~~Phypoly_transcript_03237.p1  ORF type:complete len:799 (+),score=122.12 Phypoly_transcript_03237:183-2399(+)
MDMDAKIHFDDDIIDIDYVGKDFIRVYAHAQPAKINPEERSDFTETLYWSASIKTDKNGEATVEFQMNDSVTSFAVLVDGIGQGKALGQSLFIFESKQPFYVEPKLPLEVTSGDIIELPIAVVNNAEAPLKVSRFLSVNSTALTVKNESASLNLTPGGRLRDMATLEVGDSGKPGRAQVSIVASSPTHNDNVTRTTKIVPKGFPYQLFASGLLKPDTSVEHSFTIPERTFLSSIVTEGQIYMTPVSNMTEAMKRLIQEPCGCFEQTSSTVYPLVMAQKYFQTHRDVDPDLIKQSDEILHKGYKKLIGFECKDGGYDWFGSSPASEPLTSFGILEFTEMSKVMAGVDQNMIQRCYDWLLSRRDGKGSFHINEHVLHVWSTEALMSDSYILYSLTKSGFDPAKIEPELKHLINRLEGSEDTYMLALFANILYFIKDTERFHNVLDNLSNMQLKNGTLPDPKTTVTHSDGKAKKIETISLAMLAWLNSDQPAHRVSAAKGAQYLFENSELGGYCNTQATVLAIEAIIQFDIKNATPKKPGTIQILAAGDVLQTINIDENTTGAVNFTDFAEAISLPGPHKITIRQTAGSELNYSLGVSFYAEMGDSSEKCGVHIDHLALRNTTITEGEGTEIAVKIRNKNDEPLPMTMVIVGLPGGLELRHEKMKDLVSAGKLASYELFGARLVVCYFRHMLPKQEISFEIDVVAAVPGTYTGPASCAYLYYTKEYKHWLEGMSVKITPRK